MTVTPAPVARTMADICQLPPLILHPFSGGAGDVEDLLEGSRAALALRGLIDSKDEESQLQRRMLAGRYQEVRMLLFLGKDLFRWLAQCLDCYERSGSADPRVLQQSFADLLIESPPNSVRTKLEGWGVSDRKAVFSRAIGINSLFSDPPGFEKLSPVFLENYHRFADHAYICYQHLQSFLPIDASHFHFEIYASEEYARLLSDQWDAE